MMFSIDRSRVKCLNGLKVKMPLDLHRLQGLLSIHPGSYHNRRFNR